MLICKCQQAGTPLFFTTTPMKCTFDRLRFLYMVGFVLLLWGNLQAQEARPLRVLFVGNSYTYFWNLPQTVEGMLDTMDMKAEVHQSTSGGASLGHHWRNEKKLHSHEVITEGQFDYIVLQDHSRRAVDHPDSLMLFGKRWVKEVRESGAQPYLYMTWAREFDPYMQQPIQEGYTQLAAETGATLVPVGLAWERARTLRPGFPLYDEDKSHPSPLGTYLTACVFYGVFSGKSPVGLPHRILGKDAYGEKLYLNIQSKENALFCQKVAQDILQEMRK